MVTIAGVIALGEVVRPASAELRTSAHTSIVQAEEGLTTWVQGS